MKLYYIANNQLPTSKAHGLQIVKMCEAFTDAGVDCELVIPQRPIDPLIQEHDPLKYYGIQTSFLIHRLWSFGLVRFQWLPLLGKVLFWIQQASFALSVYWFLKKSPGTIYTRDPFVAWVVGRMGMPVYWEVHSIPMKMQGVFYRGMLGHVAGVIAITHGLSARLGQVYKGPLFVAPDGVDLRAFIDLPDRAEARRRVHLPSDVPIILYAGHLYRWKGVDTLAQAASMINGIVVFVGGTEDDLARMKSLYGTISNCMFIGHRLHGEIPLWLRAADVLILPNQKDGSISEHYTSPLKLFEYMASETPIIASDISSIREILDSETAVLVLPDDPQALAQSVREVLLHYTESQKQAVVARERVNGYTWFTRARSILNFMV